jgi:hypothetical protein
LPVDGFDSVFDALRAAFFDVTSFFAIPVSGSFLGFRSSRGNYDVSVLAESGLFAPWPRRRWGQGDGVNICLKRKLALFPMAVASLCPPLGLG